MISPWISQKKHSNQLFMAFHKKYQCHWLIAISKNSQKNIHQIPYLPRDIPDDFDFFSWWNPRFYPAWSYKKRTGSHDPFSSLNYPFKMVMFKNSYVKLPPNHAQSSTALKKCLKICEWINESHGNRLRRATESLGEQKCCWNPTCKTSKDVGYGRWLHVNVVKPKGHFYLHDSCSFLWCTQNVDNESLIIIQNIIIVVCIHVCFSSPKKNLVLEDEFLPQSFFTPKISHGECTFQGMFETKGDGSILLIYIYILYVIYIYTLG